MRFDTCWLCDGQLTISREHVIPRSMGGKKTVVGFICERCNNETGHKWDVAVTGFESWLFHLNSNLSVNPRRGKSIRGKMADTGQNAFIDPGNRVRLGSNAPTKTQDEAGQVTYHLTYDPGQISGMFDAVNTLRQRNGMNSISRAEFDTQITHDETPHPVVEIPLVLDLPKYCRSMTKTAMAMAFSVGVRPAQCDNAARYLRDETLPEEGVVTMPWTSLDETVEDWAYYHAVNIFGFPGERTLIGEVLYFGKVVAVIVLSNAYEGPRVVRGHSINLKTGEYVDANFDFPDLHLPKSSVIGLLKTRAERFKSSIVLPMLNELERIYAVTR